MAAVEALDVLDDPAAAVVALDPLRSRLLALLVREPASAATLAAAVGTTRQRVTYHLGALARHGLVVEVDQRTHGGLTERLYAPSAASYVVSPAALGEAAADPARVRDRLSASYLLAVAARALREVGGLVRGARAAGQPLPTLTVDTSIRFATPAARAAFARDLDAAVVALAARHHDEAAPDGRWYRVVALAHPRPPEDSP
ncbi:helix-turn-helix domain-containing protein [Iamia majanohamensis]|uniref:helix-turn-helix domain-containing protein n=1 Tax=Iamia majanohamensis TaxID=467976 RepID=UPI003AF29D23